MNPDQRAAVITSVYNALAAKGLSKSTVGIIADEANQLALANREYSTWLPSVKDKIAVLAHHTYVIPPPPPCLL